MFNYHYHYYPDAIVDCKWLLSRCASLLIARSSSASWLLLLWCSSFQLGRHEQSGRSFHLPQVEEEVEVSVQGQGRELERTGFARWRSPVAWSKAIPLFRSSCHSVAPVDLLDRRARREIGATTDCPECPDYLVRLGLYWHTVFVFISFQCSIQFYSCSSHVLLCSIVLCSILLYFVMCSNILCSLLFSCLQLHSRLFCSNLLVMSYCIVFYSAVFCFGSTLF